MYRDNENRCKEKSDSQTTWFIGSFHCVRFARVLFSLLQKETNDPFFSYTDNKVFVALNHGKLCVFRRDMSKFIERKLSN